MEAALVGRFEEIARSWNARDREDEPTAMSPLAEVLKDSRTRSAFIREFERLIAARLQEERPLVRDAPDLDPLASAGRKDLSLADLLETEMLKELAEAFATDLDDRVITARLNRWIAQAPGR